MTKKPTQHSPRERQASKLVIRLGAGDSAFHGGARREGIAARYRRFLFLTTAIVALAFAADAMRPARAQSISGTGDISTTPIISPIWNVGHDIAIGDTTHGELSILGGGQMTSTRSVIGYNGGSSGLVTISGSGSSWTASNNFSVGLSGDGTLKVEDGGLLNAATVNLWVGENSSSSGTMNVTSGGLVSNMEAVIGNVGSTGDVTVSDFGSAWNNSSGLFVGVDGGTGTIRIEDGGVLRSDRSTLGTGAGGDATVTVSGSDGSGHVSTWINNSTLQLGNNTSSGTLNIEDGGKVTTDSAQVGQSFGGTGMLNVTGNDGDGNRSTLGVSGNLTVGQGGSGTMNVTDGGRVTSAAGFLGYDTGSDGTATVSGTDSDGNASIWAITGDLTVGNDGTGALHIENGGAVTGGNAYIAGASGLTSTVNVSGGDGNGHFSSWNVTGLLVGNDGTGTLLVEDGAAVTSVETYVGVDAGSDGTITVSGSDGSGHVSSWTNSGDVYVGYEGAGTLDVQNGGKVTTAGFAYLGRNPGGTGTVTVTGDDGNGNVSTWNVTNTLMVGYAGDATLTIDHGGIVRANDVWVALNSPVAGTINLNGDAVNGRGVLEAGMVFNTGSSTAFLNLNGGILRATRSQPGFLQGFDALTVGAEGAWFDTNGFDISVDSDFSGSSSFNKLGLGTLTLTGDSSGFTGTTEIQAGTLQLQGAVLGGPANVFAGARLTGSGQVGDTDNGGTVAPGGFFSLGTLTVAGNYTGSGGGLDIKTQLGDDSSPTDRLVVTGATSGITPVTVTNFSGAGAQTHNGIQVVEVDGASAGQFRLANGSFNIGGQPAVVGGAFGYVLKQNPADGGWYLHSSLLATGVGGGAGPGSGPAPSSPDAPIYQPGVPLYEAYARSLLSLNELSSLRQRVGNREWAASAGPKGEGAWVRMEGRQDHLEGEVSTSGLQQDIQRWKTQFGGDRILQRSPDGERLVAGVNVELGTATTDVTSFYGDGNIDTQSYGVGATLTWYESSGVYVDAQARANWFFSDLTSAVTGRQADGASGYGYGASLEAGRSLQLGSGFAFTPQAQVSYVGTDFYGFDDAFGARVASNRDESLQGRLGLSLDHMASWETAAGRTSKATVYGLIDLRQEFLDGARVLVSDTAFDNRLEQTWGGVGVGGDFSWNDGQYALYGEVRTDTGLDEVGQSYTVQGTAGFRMAL
ncbi:MAG TPA: autotransporter outer membrane beta-barrel domain-containing protein [Alphaproteobacteria bacterium]|jgi:outer membrane autotransporter protein